MIDFCVNPTKIHIRKEFAKTRTTRDIYVSDEANYYLKQWIDWKYRDKGKYRPSKIRSSRDLVFSSFNINDVYNPRTIYTTILEEFHKLLTVVGMNERKDGGAHERRKITLHSSRRFVKTVISDQTNQDYSEWFLGHNKSPYYTKKEPERREIYATKCMKYSNLLVSYLEIDPITVPIALVLSLSKPIGEVFFAVAFWKVSTTIKYEKNIKTYMIIAGCGVLLTFSANQGEAQITGLYPPFGVATMTVLNTAAFLMLIGIYNSAVLVSTNNDLRRSIYKYALGSNLLGQIGRSEMEIEMQKAVTKITKEKEHLMTRTEEEPIELDGMELKKYLEFVIREVKKDNKH